MTPTTEFEGYVTRLKNEPQKWLGQLLWYGVSESAKVPHDKLLALLRSVGLGTDGVAPPRDDDVFRRACSAAQESGRGLATGNGTFIRVLLRDVKRANREVHRQLVLEEIDAGNEVLSFTATHKVVFNSQGNTITFTEIEPSPYPHISDQVIKAISDGFDAERGVHNAFAVRELIRRELFSAQACMARPTGGVYFVMRDHAAKTEAVLKLGDAISGVSVHSLPLIDDARQRAMIREAIESESVMEIDRRLADIDQLLAGPEITPRKFQALMAEMKELVGKTESYSDLLEESLGNAEMRVKVYRKRLRTLFEHVRTPE